MGEKQTGFCGKRDMLFNRIICLCGLRKEVFYGSDFN